MSPRPNPRPPAGQEHGGKRFFVTIFAASREALLKLQQYDFDVFAPTSQATREGEFIIDGLLELQQIGRLVEDGYQVRVKHEASTRARATETAEFGEWLKDME
jgi:hypothetical protein